MDKPTPFVPYDSTKTDDLQAGFIRRLEGKKRQNADMIARLRQAGEQDTEAKYITDKLINNMEQCATYIGLDIYDDSVRVSRANFCRERICAVCAWRRQAKFVATTYTALDVLAGAGYRFIFLTLTVRNVAAPELPAAVDNLLVAWRRFAKLTPITRVMRGYIRSLEVTYNPERDDYHPHIHALLVVDAAYFEADNPEWISQAELQSLWRKAARLDYQPIIDVRTVTQKAPERAPYIETLKYALKPSKAPPNGLLWQIKALKGRRLVCFGGIVARLRALDLDDLTDASIDAPEGKSPLCCVLYKLNTTGGTYEIVEEVRADV